MAHVSFSCLITTVSILLLANPASTLTFKEKVENLEVDLKYVSQHARSIVDIVFVMDVSGSIDDNELEESKVFFKNLLEYFSIAQGHGQVGVVTFGSTSITAIPLRVDGDKCQLVKDFTTVKRANPSATNTVAGLNQAWKVLKTGRYKTSNSLRLVVLITDGEWNNGGDPAALIERMKLDSASDGGIQFLVVAVGVSPSVEAEMKSWASKIKGEPMFVYVTEYLKLAQIAYAIHNGTHESNYADVSNDECRYIGYNCEGNIPGSRSSHCMCDSFGVTGMPSCGCEKGEKLIIQGKFYGCDKCDPGSYQDTRNIKHLCKQCPALQTTIRNGSKSNSDCECEPGYWDAKIKEKTPSRNGQCSKIKCAEDKEYELDRNHIAILGTCSYLHGETCRYRCHSGYFYSRSMERTCTDSGFMDQKLPKCQVQICHPLMKDQNANSWSCLYQGRQGTTSYQKGTECKSQCKSGYVPMNGTSGNLKCITDNQSGSHVGKWSSQPLKCEARECPALPEIVNGYYDPPECSDAMQRRTFGKLCKSGCNRGFKASQTGSLKCDANGRWTNESIDVTCEDNEKPVFQYCPSDQEHKNIHQEGYYEWTVPLLSATDNGPLDQIKQSVTIIQTDRTEQILDCTTTDCKQGLAYIGDKAYVTHRAVDKNGNNVTCKYSVTVKDQDPPSTHKCEGPKTNASGIIGTPTNSAYVNWKEPDFHDNSDLNLSISQNFKPGYFDARDEYYNITYTAKDSGGNKAYCSFSFKVVNKMKNCPPLARPANGYLVCESEMFGYFCAVTCDKGFARISLSGPILPFDYMCKRGAWSPSDDTGVCAAKSTSTGVVNIVLRDYCEDKLSKKEIIDQVMKEIQDDKFRGRAAQYLASRTPEQLDKLHVFCGPKNNTLLEIDYPLDD